MVETEIVLTNIQRAFIANQFFKNEKYAGWANIANSLLKTGEAVVANTNDDKCIWHGGIGNFIKVEEADGFIDCLLYKFDRKVFLNSEWFKEIYNEYKEILSDEVSDITKEYQKKIREANEKLNDISSLDNLLKNV